MVYLNVKNRNFYNDYVSYTYFNYDKGGFSVQPILKDAVLTLRNLFETKEQARASKEVALLGAPIDLKAKMDCKSYVYLNQIFYDDKVDNKRLNYDGNIKLDLFRP